MDRHTELSFIDEFRWVSPLYYLKTGWQNAVLLWCMLQAGPPSLHHYCAVMLHSCVVLPPVGHSSNHHYHCCQLTRQSSCVSNFYRTFKIFIWVSLESTNCILVHQLDNKVFESYFILKNWVISGKHNCSRCYQQRSKGSLGWEACPLVRREILWTNCSYKYKWINDVLQWRNLWASCSMYKASFQHNFDLTTRSFVCMFLHPWSYFCTWQLSDHLIGVVPYLAHTFSFIISFLTFLVSAAIQILLTQT